MKDEEKSAVERRRLSLEDIDIDSIAERAADKALERVYGEVGRAVLRKLALLLGAALIALVVWLNVKFGIR